MKHACYTILLLLAFLAAFLPCPQTRAENGTAGGTDKGRIRVLVFYGGHPFNLEEFKSTLFADSGMDVSYAVLPDERDRLAPGLEKEFDVLVMFDMDQKDPSPAQKEALKALLDCGIGYFSFHHDTCALFNWDEYYDICGGKAMLDYAYPNGSPCATFRGQRYPFSTFLMGDADFRVADPDHPVMRGVHDFSLHEELYGKILVNPDVHVLLASDSPNMTHAAAWTWHYNNSPVFTTILGHDASMWGHPDFNTMFINAIKWLAAETRKERAALETVP